MLSTIVSLLILFRSLDGSSPAARRLQKLCPWLPLPPAVGLRKNEAAQLEGKPTRPPTKDDREMGANVPVMVQLAREKVEGEAEKLEEGEADKDWLRRGSDNSTMSL